MNWNNLRSQYGPCCPKCGYRLEKEINYSQTFANISSAIWKCQNSFLADSGKLFECAFKIGDVKLRELQTKKSATKRKFYEANYNN